MLEFGVAPPLGYKWGSNGAYDEWRAGSARLAITRINAAVATSGHFGASNGCKFESEHRRAALQGFATVYNQPHLYKGRIEAFSRGCFDRGLVAGAPAISLLVAHDDSQLVATTADYLELRSTPEGLAFRCRLPDTDLGREVHRRVKSRNLSAMSVSYHTRAEEVVTIEGSEVHLLRDVALREISVCNAGAVSKAFATVIDPETSSFADAIKSGAIPADGAFVRFMRSLAKLQEAA